MSFFTCENCNKPYGFEDHWKVTSPNDDMEYSFCSLKCLIQYFQRWK